MNPAVSEALVLLGKKPASSEEAVAPRAGGRATPKTLLGCGLRSWLLARGLRCNYRLQPRLLRLQLFIQDFHPCFLSKGRNVSGKLLFDRLLSQTIFDAGDSVGKLDLVGRKLLTHLDDVITVGGGDDVADLVGAHGKGRCLNLGHHSAMRECVFAAPGFRDRVVGGFSCQLGKVFPSTSALEQCFRFFAPGGLLVWRERGAGFGVHGARSEEHTSELQSLRHRVCRLLLEKKK